MSVTAKGIQLFIWRIIRFSGSCCYKFVRRFPDVSGIFIFVLFLYIFSPYFFSYFMYSFPIVVCSAIYIRFYLKTRHPGSQRIKKNESGESLSADGKLVNKSNEPSLRPQISVRQNARKEVVEWDGKHSEKKNVPFVRCAHYSLSGKTNETGTDRALDVPNTVFINETSKPHRVSDDSFKGSLGTGPGDGKLVLKRLEESGGAGKKATRDVHRNRMDLGLERNKRLHSFIAKRRTKKLFRMAIEKSLKGIHKVPPSQLAQILIPKNNNGGVPSNLDEDELMMPGSAPSLWRKRNSFDLSYDLQDEKPNLMADSFQQEFMPVNQKEMFFCRHESFRRGPWFPYPTSQNRNDTKFNLFYGDEKRHVETKSDKVGHHRLNSSGIENDFVLVELEEPNHNKAVNLLEEEKERILESLNNRTEIGEKMENPHDLEPGLDSGSEVRMETGSIKNNDSCYSSSSENTEPVLDQTINSTGIHNDHVRRALKLAIPPKGRAMNRLSFDSSSSPSERRRSDFNSFYSRRQCHPPTFSIASDLQVEVPEVGSPPLTIDGTVSSVDGDLVTYDGDVDRDINSEIEELWGGSSKLAREEANRKRLRELGDIIEDESVEVASISPSEHEAKQNMNSTSSLSARIDITENGASLPIYINYEAHPGSSNCSHDNFETSYEVKSTIESGKEVEESKPSKYIEEHTRTLNEHKTIDAPNAVQRRDNLESVPEIIVDQVEESQPSKYIEEDTQTLTELNTRDAPNRVQSSDNLKSVPDTKVDKDAAENNILEKRLRDSIARALNRRLMLEQVSVSSFLSPRSVLPQNILPSPTPVSGVGRRMQRSLSHFVRQDVVRSKLAYEQAREKLTAYMPHIAHEWVENSINQLTRNRSLGTLEMAPRKVIEEGNIVLNVNNSAGTGKEEGKKLTGNGESLFLIRPEGISRFGKSNEQEADMNKTETIESDCTRVVESEKERETANEGESLFLIRPEDISGPEKSNEQEADMNETETIGSDYTSIVESAKERENSAAEVDRICKSNESVADNVANKEIKNNVLEREGALQILGKLEAVIEASNTTGETSAGSVEDTEPESKRLAKTAFNAGQSTSAGETNTLNNIKNDEKIQILTGQGVMDASESGEDDLKVTESILNVESLTKENDTEIDPSKSEKDNAKSDDTETMEPTNSRRKVTKEGSIVTGFNDLAVNDKEGEKLTTNKGVSHFSISKEGIGGPEELNELEADVNKPEANGYTRIVETTKQRKNSAVEVDNIFKDNESVADNVTNKEIKTEVIEREDALRVLGKLEAVIEPSNTSRKTSEGFVEDIEHESKRLAEAEANSGLSTSAGETNSLNNIKNGQEMQNMSRQEGINDASKSREGDLKAIDRIPDVDNITEDTSKPTESEVKATKTEEKYRNEVAKTRQYI